MSKRLKMLTASLLLSCIMIASFAGAAFADMGNGPERIGEGDCTSDCGTGPHYTGSPQYNGGQ